MSSPKKRMVPEEGGKSPVMQLNSVVLPAPLEPSTARRSPGRTVMVTSVSAASAPNSRVTPRSSSAAPAPTADSRRATLSMAAPSAAALGRAAMVAIVLAPALPQADHAVRRPQHDGEEHEPDQQPEAVAVEPDLDQEVEREGAQEDEDEGADERAHGARDAADDSDDEDVDAALHAHRARRDLLVVPDLQDSAERGDERGEGVGRDAVGVDVEAERGHAARVVPYTLQRQAERRAREV